MLISLEIPTQLSETFYASTFPVNLQVFSERIFERKSRVRGLILSMLHILQQGRRDTTNSEGISVILITSNEIQDEQVEWLKRASNIDTIVIYRPKPDEVLESLHYSNNKDVLLSTLPLSYSQIKKISSKTGYVLYDTQSNYIEREGVGNKEAKSFFIPYTSSVFSRVIGNKQIYSVPNLDFLVEAINERKNWIISETQDDPAEIIVLSSVTRELRTELNKITSTLPPDTITQREVIYNLGLCCMYRKFDLIKELLIHSSFSIRDDLYRHRFCSTFSPDLLVNDSAFLLRCAVAGGSSAIINILLHETSPIKKLSDSFQKGIDPSTMNNIALRDAILGNKEDIIQLIASDPRVMCSKVYYKAKKYRLDELIFAEVDPNNKNFSKELNVDSLEIYNMKLFQKFFQMDEDEVRVKVEELDLLDKVRDTHLHRVLLLTLRESYNSSDKSIKDKSKKLADLLCLASNMRERTLKKFWA